MSELHTTPVEWSGPALATLYRASVSFGTQEQQLIWTRYTGFLIINGFFVSAYTASLGDKASSSNDGILLLVGILGLLINAIWHILNFSGWQNQCLWFHRAANVSSQLSIFKLPTDDFKNSVLIPFGWIYWLAQTVPTVFSMIAAAAVIYALQTASYNLSALGIVSWPILVTWVLLIEYLVIARSAQKLTLA